MKAKVIVISLMVLAVALLPRMGTCAPPTPAGELVVAISNFEQETFLPYMMTPSTRNYGGHIYDTIVGVNPEGKPDPAYGLAEKWEASEGAKVWTFYLKKGIKFHNGEELTAEDVKFSFEKALLKEARSSFAKYFRAQVEEIKVLDRYNVQVILKSPDAFFANLLTPVQSSEGLIMPKKYFEQVGDKGFNEKPIGTGPWKFVSKAIGDYVEFEANEQHWQQVPQFKKLRILNIPEEYTRLAMLKRGEVDIAVLSSALAKEVEAAGLSVKSIREVAAVDVILYQNYSPDMIYHDKRVRKALCLAIDRETIVKQVFGGRAKVATYPSFTSVMPGFDSTLPPYPYDLKEAKRLLAEAGYPNGFSLKFYMFPMAGVPQLRDVAQAVVGYWEKIGVKAELIPLDSLRTIRTKYIAEPQKFEPPGEVSTVRLPNMPAGGILVLWYLPREEGGVVTLARGVPRMAELWNKAKREIDPLKREKIMSQTLKVAYDELVALPVAYADAIFGVGKDVAEWTPTQGTNYDPCFHRAVPAK